jgi:hypothetical protein
MATSDALSIIVRLARLGTARHLDLVVGRISATLISGGDLGSLAKSLSVCRPSLRACDYFATDLVSVVQRLLR